MCSRVLACKQLKGRWLVWKTIPAPGYIGMDLNSRHHGEKAWKIVKKACSNFMWTAIPNVGHLYSVCGLPGPRRTLHKFLQGSFQVCIFYLFEICRVYLNLFQHHARLQRIVDWNRVSSVIPPASIIDLNIFIYSYISLGSMSFLRTGVIWKSSARSIWLTNYNFVHI